MSNYSYPERPVAEIITVLAETKIACLKPDDLSNPTADVVCSLYSNFLHCIDPLGGVADGQIGFDALELLDNPDHHVDAIRVINLYKKVKDVLESICYGNFEIRDLLKPDPRRILQILSTMVNFLIYRDEKLIGLQPIADQFPGYEDRKMELEKKIIEHNKELMDNEVARQLEEPLIHETDADIKKLKQSIQNYNKQQMSLKAMSGDLVEKTKAISDKISQADFELMKIVQENTTLRSKIVQSPDKLQKAREEKIARKNEVKNSERLAIQNVQQINTTLEVYSKASEKLQKLVGQAQKIQEQVNKAKGIDKDIKTYRAKLSEEAISNISFDAKIDELQGKAKQTEELIKAMEKESNTRRVQDSQGLKSVRKELEGKLHCLERRGKTAEAMAAKGASLRIRANSVGEAGKLKQQKLLAKLEETVDAFNVYSNTTESALLSLQIDEATVID